MTYVKRGIRAVDTTSDHLSVMHEHAADGRFVGCQGHLRHLDGFAHEAFMVLAVGYRSEHHREATPNCNDRGL